MRILKAFAAALLLVTCSAAFSAEFEWRYYSTAVPTHPYARLAMEAFRRVDERTHGRLKITFASWGETPYKPSDALTVMRDGLGEMGDWLIAYSTNTYPVLSAPELPFISPKLPTPAQLMATSDRSWSSPLMQKEVDTILAKSRVTALSSFYWPPQNYWFRNVVQSPAAFKNLRIREYTPEGIDLLKGLGANPVSMTSPEVYTSLQMGALDGVITSANTITGFKWYEVLKSGYVVNTKLARTVILVSDSAAKRLPPDVRQILNEEMTNYANALRKFMVDDEANTLQLMRTNYKMQVTVASDADYAKFRDLARQQVWPHWLERVGPRGKDLLNGVLQASGANDRF